MNYKVAFVSGSLSGAVALGIVGGLFASPALALVGLAALNGAVCLLGKEDEKDVLKRKLDTLEGKLNREIEHNNTLEDTLALRHHDLEKAKTLLKELANKDAFQLNEIDNLQAELRLQAGELRIKTDDLTNAKGELADLKEELNNINNNWDEILKDEVEKVYQERITNVLENNWNKHCELIERCMKEGEKYKEILLEYQELFEIQEEEALAELNRIRAKFTEMLNDLNNRESDLLSVQETLFLKIDELKQEKTYLEGQLEASLNADLLEPKYGKFGFQWDARIADEIARLLWRNYNLPLAVQGFQTNSDGSAEAAYGYSRSQDVEALIFKIQSLSNVLAKEMGIHKITSIRKYPMADLVIISWRLEAPKPEVDEDIYKKGLIKSTEALDLILKAIDHTRGGRPTMRIMASTGQGKGLLMKNLLALMANEEGYEIWLSDPLDGSDQDYWDCPKLAKNKKEAGEVYGKFTEVFNQRNQKDLTDKAKIVGVFDEFDAQHSETDKDEARENMTAIRHGKMAQILIGQSAEVGRNRWTWDNMGNCSLVVLGDSIGTLQKHLVKDLGWTLKKANEVKAQYELFTEWANKKNEANPDIPNENKYRIGLLVVGGKFQFFELPNAHKGIIRNGLSTFKTTLEECVEEVQLTTPTNQRLCPICNSKMRKSGDRLRCENKAHTKEMGAKSYLLN